VWSQTVLPGMIAGDAGRIVNITSEAEVLRWPQASAYSVAKAAVIKFTENLAAEAGRGGVQVFSVHPGVTPIGLTERALADSAAPGLSGGTCVRLDTHGTAGRPRRRSRAGCQAHHPARRRPRGPAQRLPPVRPRRPRRHFGLPGRPPCLLSATPPGRT
jgi:NAD(P)-dependent dehydrogenase (short-subunit alcohol dehydrogenase family)